MPLDAATLKYLEDALSECFQYHRGLDDFVLRSGVSQGLLQLSRNDAEERARLAQRQYERAPKRFVAQALINHLSAAGTEGDVIVSNIVTSLLKSQFPDASITGKEALEKLRTMQNDKAVRKNAREEQNKIFERARQEKIHIENSGKRAALRDRFQSLISEDDAQRRGYLLESFLRDFFEAEGLEPRGSFRLSNEQIDGSFQWESRTHLLEAKWTAAKSSGAEFGAFLYKIEGKTADTRGLFLSINGYANGAIPSLQGKGALKFICVDGAHIMRALAEGQSLPRLLGKLWRWASETGTAYLPVSEMSD